MNQIIIERSGERLLKFIRRGHEDYDRYAYVGSVWKYEDNVGHGCVEAMTNDPKNEDTTMIECMRATEKAVFEAIAGRELSQEDRHELIFYTASILNNQRSFESVLESVLLRR